jgi:hypothetical protein
LFSSQYRNGFQKLLLRASHVIRKSMNWGTCTGANNKQAEFNGTVVLRCHCCGLRELKMFLNKLAKGAIQIQNDVFIFK